MIEEVWRSVQLVIILLRTYDTLESDMGEIRASFMSLKYPWVALRIYRGSYLVDTLET